MEENDAGKVRPKPTAKPKQSKAKQSKSTAVTEYDDEDISEQQIDRRALRAN